MAATMATDIGQSVTGTIPGGDRFRKAQNIYSSSGNENGSRTIRSSPPSQNSQSQNDRGNPPNHLLVEPPKTRPLIGCPAQSANQRPGFWREITGIHFSILDKG